MRKFIQWFFALAIIFVIGMISAYLLAKRFEEPVRNYIVEQVNKRLQAPVHVSDINFSLLERFPSASLVMDSVWAEENLVKIGKADTLFYFRKVYLNLELFGILKGQYKINEIEARDGFMRLLVDDEGYDNYHIWKPGSDTTGFLLELDKVHIENSAFTFSNLLRRQHYDLIAEDLNFKGRFSKDSYTMGVEGEGYVNDLSIKGTSYIRNREVEVDTDLDIITSEERYAFRKGKLVIDDAMTFSVAGAFVKNGIDLKVEGQNLDIIRSLSLLPTESRSVFDPYESNGVLSFSCTLKGAFGKTENPGIEADFSFDDASIRRKGSKWKLSNLSGKGHLSNGQAKDFSTVNLSIEDIKGALNDDPFSAEMAISNFNTPSIQGKATISSDLSGIKAFFDLQSLEQAEGPFTLDASISTTLSDLDKVKPEDFLNARASGIMKLANSEVKFKDDDRVYSIDTAAFTLQNNDLFISTYFGMINSCAIQLEGQAKGFLSYLFTDDGVVDVNGQVITGEINLDELFAASTSSKSGVLVAFPERSRWNLSVVSEAFVQGKFEATEISGQLKMDPFKVEASALHFISQGGDVQGRAGIYKFSENQIGMKTSFTSSDVDIKQLFYTFENFDQTFITSEVLEGRLDAQIDFQAFCDSTLSIDLPSVIASADVRIKEGALIGFKPLIGIADEIKKKPMLRLFISVDELRKRLEEVRFATLENEISIRNGMVTIPKMEIKSSALNINASGTHSFSNQIDYEIDFAMSEVLTLKDRTEPYNEFVSRDDQGKTRMYLTMIGTTDDYEVEIQRTDVKKSIKEEINQEKQTVKSLLNEEFGVFKNDTTLKQEESEKQSVPIEFDPEGKAEPSTPSTDSKAEPSSKKPKEEKSLFNKLIKKTESDKKKLKEGDFEDDDF